MIDNLLKKYGVGLALTLMVLELAYINAKSLIFMSKGLVGLDQTFNILGVDSTMGLVGSFAFSTVTVLIMRLSKRNWLKLVFPLFDFCLVFLGFNIEYAADFYANPFRFWYSIFIAAFAGFTTYSLGQINAEQHETDMAGKLLTSERERNLLQTKLQEADVTIASLTNSSEKYKEGYLLYHRGRILKKSEKNRTAEECELLTDCDSLLRKSA
jgi:hypothetical protein